MCRYRYHYVDPFLSWAGSAPLLELSGIGDLDPLRRSTASASNLLDSHHQVHALRLDLDTFSIARLHHTARIAARMCTENNTARQSTSCFVSPSAGNGPAFFS